MVTRIVLSVENRTKGAIRRNLTKSGQIWVWRCTHELYLEVEWNARFILRVGKCAFIEFRLFELVIVFCI